MDAGEAVKFNWSEHLWIVISDPKQNRGKVLLVNFSSVKPSVRFDDACVVDVGDHPYIKKKTFVYYDKARVATDRGLEKEISSGQADASAYDRQLASCLIVITSAATMARPSLSLLCVDIGIPRPVPSRLPAMGGGVLVARILAMGHLGGEESRSDQPEHRPANHR